MNNTLVHHMLIAVKTLVQHNSGLLPSNKAVSRHMALVAECYFIFKTNLAQHTFSMCQPVYQFTSIYNSKQRRSSEFHVNILTILSKYIKRMY